MVDTNVGPTFFFMVLGKIMRAENHESGAWSMINPSSLTKYRSNRLSSQKNGRLDGSVFNGPQTSMVSISRTQVRAKA